MKQRATGEQLLLCGGAGCLYIPPAQEGLRHILAQAGDTSATYPWIGTALHTASPPASPGCCLARSKRVRIGVPPGLCGYALVEELALRMTANQSGASQRAHAAERHDKVG